MSTIGSNAIAAQIYGGIQNRNKDSAGTNGVKASPTAQVKEFRVPQNATPSGDWVLSENANPQNFDGSSPRGTYLNLVVEALLLNVRYRFAT